MSREETVIATTIVVDNINQRTNLRVVGRAPTRHQRFDNGVVNSSGQQYTQSGSSQNEQNITPVGFVCHHYNIEQSQIQGYPRLGIGQRQNDIIQEHRIAAIHHQQQLLVKLNDFFHIK